MAPVLKPEQEEIEETPLSPVENGKSDFELKEILIRQAVMMGLWYLFSFGSIISNKYILSSLNGDAGVLGETQMLSSVIFGAFKMYLPCCLFHHGHQHQEGKHKVHFFRNMAVLGWMR